jgi:hypothetical protein
MPIVKSICEKCFLDRGLNLEEDLDYKLYGMIRCKDKAGRDVWVKFHSECDVPDSCPHKDKHEQ